MLPKSNFIDIITTDKRKEAVGTKIVFYISIGHYYTSIMRCARSSGG